MCSSSDMRMTAIVHHRQGRLLSDPWPLQRERATKSASIVQGVFPDESLTTG